MPGVWRDRAKLPKELGAYPECNPSSVCAFTVRPEWHYLWVMPEHASPAHGGMGLLEGQEVVVRHEAHGMLALDFVQPIPPGK